MAVVPSVFWIGTEESFIIPKLIVSSVIAVACALALVAGLDRSRPQPTFIDICALLFAGVVFVSYLASVDRDQSLWGEEYQRQGLYSGALYLVFYAFARTAVVDRVRLRVLANGVSFGGIPVALYAVAQRAGLDPLWDEIPGGRVFSTIGQTNSLGAYLALVLPISLGLAIVGGRRTIGWIVVGIQGAALVLTESRGGYLGMVIGLSVFAVLTVRLQRADPRRVLGIIVVAAVVLGVGATTTPGLSDSSRRAWSRALSADEWTTGSVRNHLDLWEVAEAVVADHLLLGTGPDTFPLVFGDYRDDVLPADSAARLRIYRVESPHNIVLAHAAGSGLPAAALFLLIILGPVMLATGSLGPRREGQQRGGPVDVGVVAGICGGFVASLFITADFSTTWLMWILAGALVAIAANDDRAERYRTIASISGGIATSSADAGPHSTSV
ncbi:MAG: O-antigen ligase family protein [Acidimicrobiales bacterium]